MLNSFVSFSDIQIALLISLPYIYIYIYLRWEIHPQRKTPPSKFPEKKILFGDSEQDKKDVFH
jgi:hypothetical protein